MVCLAWLSRTTAGRPLLDVLWVPWPATFLSCGYCPLLKRLGSVCLLSPWHAIGPSVLPNNQQKPSCVLRDIAILFPPSCLAFIFSPVCASFIFKLGSTEGQHGQPRQIPVHWVPESNLIGQCVLKVLREEPWKSIQGLREHLQRCWIKGSGRKLLITCHILCPQGVSQECQGNTVCKRLVVTDYYRVGPHLYSLIKLPKEMTGKGLTQDSEGLS